MPREELTDAQAAILMLLLYAIHAAGMWGIFTKAGRSPQLALIPIRNFVELCRISQVSSWWLLAIFVPGLNLVMAIYLGIRLAQHFHWSSKMGVLFGLSGFLTLSILGFSRAEYDGQIPAESLRSTLSPRKKETTPASPKALMISLSIFYGLGILCFPGLLVICAMSYDAPGSQENTALHVMVGSILLAPVTMLLSLIVGWILFRMQKHLAAFVAMLLPILNVIGFFVGVVMAILQES